MAEPQQQSPSEARPFPGGGTLFLCVLGVSFILLLVGVGLLAGWFEGDGDSPASSPREDRDTATVTLDARDANGVRIGIVQPGEAIEVRYIEGQLVTLTEPTFPPYYWNIISRDGSQRRVGEYTRSIWGGNQYPPGWEERFPYARCNIPPFAVVLVFGPPENAPCNKLRPFTKETLSARNLLGQPLEAHLVLNDSTHYWVDGNTIFLDSPGGNARRVDSYTANAGSATFAVITK